jgi:hypothetical protein
VRERVAAYRGAGIVSPLSETEAHTELARVLGMSDRRLATQLTAFHFEVFEVVRVDELSVWPVESATAAAELVRMTAQLHDWVMVAITTHAQPSVAA